jgi:hypothetical protein
MKNSWACHRQAQFLRRQARWIQAYPETQARLWDKISRSLSSSMGGQAAINMPQYALPPGPPPKKFYTFQRVNGNGGNGKGDGVAGPHKHTLEESDRVKKNSVVRWQAKIDKDDRKKAQVSVYSLLVRRSFIVSC